MSRFWHRRTLSQSLLWLGLLLVAVTSITPFIWMFATSFKRASDVYTTVPTLLPINHKTGQLYLNLDNYQFVIDVIGLGTAIVNSLFVVVILVPAKLLLDALAAYAFARIPFRGKNVLYTLVLSSIMVPGVALLIPRVYVTQLLGLYDSLWALIIPMLLSVWDIFLLRQFFITLPIELEEAAKIDGASRLMIFWRVVLPLSRPVLSVVVITSFIYHWNDLVWPLVTITSQSNYTAPLALALLNGQPNVMQYTMAGATLVTLPVIIVFLIFQRHILQGITLTGLKG